MFILVFQNAVSWVCCFQQALVLCNMPPRFVT